MPREFSVQQNFPIPLNPNTRIDYSPSAPRQVSVGIFSELGLRRSSLGNGMRPAGTHQFYWDDSDGAGNLLASGSYFYHLTVNDSLDIGKSCYPD